MSYDPIDVTLVFEDACLRLDWCDSGEWGWSCLSKQTKLSFGEIYFLMEVVFWWKLPIDESYNRHRSDILWRLVCGDVYIDSLKKNFSMDALCMCLFYRGTWQHSQQILNRWEVNWIGQIVPKTQKAHNSVKAAQKSLKKKMLTMLMLTLISL